MPTSWKIAVLGANGHTGRFVVAELQKRGLVPIMIGRDREKLTALAREAGDAPWRVADYADSHSLDEAVAGAAMIVNCAGPFFDTAEPAIASALRRKIHYLDVTAEQITALNSFHRHHHDAVRADIAIVPAMAFYGGLADLMATAAMGDWPSAERLTVAIALDLWHPTQGTRQTGARNTGQRYWLKEGRLDFLPDAPPEVFWEFAEPFGRQEMAHVPLSEVITVSRHLDLREIISLMNLAPLRDLGNPQTPPPAAVDASGRSSQRFAVEVKLERGSDSRTMSIAGRDIYATSAVLVAEAALWLCEGRVLERGTLAPGYAFSAAKFLAATLNREADE
jgi:short subunit dehydrogenase-like uncharacterized protein